MGEITLTMPRGNGYTYYQRFFDEMLKNNASKPKRTVPPIKKVIFNPPATIVIWSDDTKTVVKAENEVFDPEKGLAMAITKRALGGKGNYFNEIKKWTETYDVKSDYPKTVAHDAKWCAYQRLQNALNDKKATKADLLIAMEEASGYLGEALDG